MAVWLVWIHLGYTSVSTCKYRHQRLPYKQGVAGATSAFGRRGPFGGETSIVSPLRKAPGWDSAGGLVREGVEVRCGCRRRSGMPR